jgi:hypothetical protein
MAPLPGSTTVRRSAAGVSWLALLAATTLGAGRFDQIRARVSGSAEVGKNYRLVVQSYAKDALDSAGLPSRYARPIASTQRAVTPEELETGVSVSVMQVADELEKNPVVIAWIEPGEADLEFDARAARPQPGASYAVSDAGADDDASVDLVLGRRAA